MRRERLSSLLSFLEAHTLKGPSDSRRVSRAKVRLLLTLPDGQPPLGIDATLVRSGPDGDLFSFLNLERGQFRRLQRFLKQGDRHDR